MQKEYNNIPPLILDMALKLSDKNTPDNIRYNYRTTLLSIQEFCKSNIEKYDREANFKKARV